ncbi:MAG: hypothetical protein JSS60_02680 [Verrucomicrobia bacterium]|nr:hypothetical protein [Verrucomicrobiota bacterium]
MNRLQKSLFLVVALLLTAGGFADNLFLENLTSYPQKDQNSKIAVQWANSAKDVEEGNQALVAGSKLSPKTMQFLTRSGKIEIAIPQKATYFRVLAWSKGSKEPDFHTNWVEIIPNKTYTLKDDLLVPSVLMAGMGC